MIETTLFDNNEFIAFTSDCKMAIIRSCYSFTHHKLAHFRKGGGVGRGWLNVRNRTPVKRSCLNCSQFADIVYSLTRICICTLSLALKLYLCTWYLLKQATCSSCIIHVWRLNTFKWWQFSVTKQIFYISIKV